MIFTPSCTNIKKAISLFSALYLLAFPLVAELADHFKPALGKGDHHSLGNIDFIYMINLDQRPEKFNSCLQQLAPYDVHPYRFSAVNGWELSLEAINMLGVSYEPWMRQNLWATTYLLENEGQPLHEIMHVTGRNYFCHCMSRGAIGCLLSHLSVLQDAYDSGYETIWVMEDDIEVLRHPHEICHLIDKLDELVGKDGWGILFTDQDTKNQKGEYVVRGGAPLRANYTSASPERFDIKRRINRNFRMIGSRYGTYSMILRRQAIKKLLDFYKTYSLFLPYDIDLFFVQDIRYFTVIQDVVSTQPQAASDNGSPYYKNKTR